MEKRETTVVKLANRVDLAMRAEERTTSSRREPQQTPEEPSGEMSVAYHGIRVRKKPDDSVEVEPPRVVISSQG